MLQKLSVQRIALEAAGGSSDVGSDNIGTYSLKRVVSIAEKSGSVVVEA